MELFHLVVEFHRSWAGEAARSRAPMLILANYLDDLGVLAAATVLAHAVKELR